MANSKVTIALTVALVLSAVVAGIASARFLTRYRLPSVAADHAPRVIEEWAEVVTTEPGWNSHGFVDTWSLES